MQKRRDIEKMLLQKLNRNELYFKSIEESLINDIRLEQFIKDLENGDGNELSGDKPKFLSISSSSALAINSFAFWKDYYKDLVFFDQTDFFNISFERKFENGLKSKFKPNIDVVLENSKFVFAIESKFLEFFKRPKVLFSAQYVDIIDKRKQTAWYEVMLKLKSGKIKYKYFDAVQIVKHYYGLALLDDSRIKKLVYLFWVPNDKTNYVDYISEIEHFSNEVKQATDVTFEYINYNKLWQYWIKNAKDKQIRLYIDNLIKRYII